MSGEETLYDLLKKRLPGFLTDRPISNVKKKKKKVKN